ncbi:hypothetical protein A3A64_02335 [Candidatus Gottesmanbacteria bacterium RIFCSPLOWO2_01_FULL_48_11]|uniref:Uncharacterized protein n=2 Tax=Candidatus Gottesmaniibacteriota TaxID=1752720 RepID=A0A0G1X135_9BACT|nr:MAG: hypothetical protein UY16_C0013G0040 [Candidatus Gottesmanbacteria bacterium GW2011_GWA2_47_9]OGG28300.1 MAG: hypothetical protein A3A64_02335 [Candidatus Gottesmanbacteria bacterium RIFCSPLOWO2_01_FULL_48_11]
MKKRTARRHHASRRTRSPRSNPGQYVAVIRGWMFVVAFALMLGMGAILGNFFKAQLDTTTPQVAGVQIEVK